LTDMRGSLERLETRANRKRALALLIMEQADIRKLPAPDFTASLRSGAPAVAITAQNLVPEKYWRPQPSQLDRQTLLADLKAGIAIAGAALSPRKTQLSVRTQ